MKKLRTKISIMLVFSMLATIALSTSVFAYPPSDSRPVGNYSFAGSTTVTSTAGHASTSYGTVAGLTAKVVYVYTWGPINNPTSVSVTAQNSNSTTSISASATYNSSHALNRRSYKAEGYHTLSYGGTQSLRTTDYF